MTLFFGYRCIFVGPSLCFDGNWIDFAYILRLGKFDAVVWILSHVNSCESEISGLFGSEWIFGFQLGYLLIEVLIPPMNPIIDMNTQYP